MRHIEPRDEKYLLCFFDFESDTSLELTTSPKNSSLTDHDSDDRFDDDDDPSMPVVKLHRVNCVSAMLFCHECCRNAFDNSGKCQLTVESSTSECQNGLCRKIENGERRIKTWINGVDGCIDALNSFLIWLINGLPGGTDRPYGTYVIGHYCGRYFLVGKT